MYQIDDLHYDRPFATRTVLQGHHHFDGLFEVVRGGQIVLPRGGGGSSRVSARLGRLPYTAPRGDLGSSWLDLHQITFPFMVSKPAT